MDIRFAAMVAFKKVELGELIKGILVHEDTFYAYMKKQPKFKGIIGFTTGKGRTEFYVRPLTETDMENLQIVEMDSYLLTKLSKEDLEKKLASYNKL